MGELRYAGRRVPTRRRRLTVDLCAQMDLCLMIFVLSAIHPDKMVHALQAPRPPPPPPPALPFPLPLPLLYARSPSIHMGVRLPHR